MKTHQKLRKKDRLKNRDLVPTIQLEKEFSQTCGFCVVLDNIELITYKTFQKMLMTECKDIGKKHQNDLKMGFPFQKSGSVIFVPL